MSLHELERRQAAELAEARQDYYVSAPGQQGLQGPLSEREMRLRVDEHLFAGRKPLVLRAVEDYGR